MSDLGSPTVRDVFDWLDRVCADGELPPRAFAVAYTIARHFKRKRGSGFPGQANIVAQTGFGERTVRDAIHALQERGHLEVGSTKGGAA